MSRKISRRISAVAHEVLRYLAEKGPTQATQIAIELKRDPGTISYSLKRLRKLELVDRSLFEKPNGQPAGIWSVAVTPSPTSTPAQQ